MGHPEPESGTAPRFYMAIHSGRDAATNHWSGPAVQLQTPRRMQKQPPARRGHISIHARPRRAIIGSQCESHRRRHAPSEPPRWIPRGDQINRDPSRGMAEHPALSSLPPNPPCFWLLCCGQGWVRLHVAGRYSHTCQGTMVIRPPSRAQEGERLEAVWRLPSPERSHSPQQITSPTHIGLRPLPFLLHHIFQNWSREGLSSNSCPSWRH